MSTTRIITRRQLERVRDRLGLARRHDEASRAALNEAAAVLAPIDEELQEAVADVLLDWSVFGTSVEAEESSAVSALARLGFTIED